MCFSLPFLSRASETHNKSGVSQMERATTAGGERERIAERKMSVLFINLREHLADSFTNIWQPHLLACQSPWLVLQSGADRTPWEFGCCLDSREKLETFALSKPTLQFSTCKANKSRLVCVFFEQFFIFLNFILFFHILMLWYRIQPAKSRRFQLISRDQQKCKNWSLKIVSWDKTWGRLLPLFVTC